MKRTFQNCSCSNDETLPLIWQNFSCYSVRALESLPGLLQSHKNLSPWLLRGAGDWDGQRAPTGRLPWCSSLDQLSWRMRKADWKGCTASTTIQQEWKRHLCFSQRGCLLYCRSGITHHVLPHCDIFRNSINLSSVSVTLICVWQYLFPFKSSPKVRTSVTRQNYTLHSLLKWQWARVMKDMWFKLPF